MVLTRPHVIVHHWGGIWGCVQGRKPWVLVGHQSLRAGSRPRTLNGSGRSYPDCHKCYLLLGAVSGLRLFLSFPKRPIHIRYSIYFEGQGVEGRVSVDGSA